MGTDGTDSKDRFAQGEPDVIVPLNEWSDLIGLKIRDLPGRPMLGIRRDHMDRPLGALITTELYVNGEEP